MPPARYGARPEDTQQYPHPTVKLTCGNWYVIANRNINVHVSSKVFFYLKYPNNPFVFGLGLPVTFATKTVKRYTYQPHISENIDLCMEDMLKTSRTI